MISILDLMASMYTAPRYAMFQCGQDIKAGQFVYGVRRIYVIREWGRMMNKYARGIATADAREGDFVEVQTYGYCSVEVIR